MPLPADRLASVICHICHLYFELIFNICVVLCILYYQSVKYYYTRNILDCDQPNYSSRIILSHITANLLSW